MGNVYVTDMTHFEGIPPGSKHEPARKIANFFGSIVSAASVSPRDKLIDSALACRRHTSNAGCPGHLQIQRDSASSMISWCCLRCGDQGEIRNWEGTHWNLSRWAPQRPAAEQLHELMLTEDEMRELRGSLLLGMECRSLLYMAVIAHGGIVIRATLDELEDLQENVAAEANHETKKRRQKILDQVYERIESVFEQEAEDALDLEEEEQGERLESSSNADGFVKEWEQKMQPPTNSLSPASKPVPADLVERTWRRIGGLPPREGKKLIQLMTKEQPVILAYLIAVDKAIFNGDERQELLYLGVVVWQIMRQWIEPLPVVTEKTLDKAEERNTTMAEDLQGETESGIEEFVKKMINTYRQPEVLRYIMEAIMEETEDAPHIREESKGIMLLDLKTVIDCFTA